MSKTIAIMTGGGDAPGLNAVIRAVVKRGVSGLGWRVLGITDSFDGLMTDPKGIRSLDRDDVRGILRMGGTILGTTNRGNPFEWEGRGDCSAEMATVLRSYGVEGLIGVGGDGTLGICYELMKRTGVPVIGVPKTIDNDVPFTDVTFGFDTAMSYAAEAVDRLHTTAESHERVMVLEVMGRDSGALALHSGTAGGADVILIPEIPFEMEPVIAKVSRRSAQHRNFSIVVVAEGAAQVGGEALYEAGPSGRVHLGGIGRLVAEKIAAATGLDTRYIVLGHLQRGGSPTPTDRILATRFGSHAVELVEAGRWGRMGAMGDGKMDSVPLDAVGVAPARSVPVAGDLMRAARGVGIVFGDEVCRLQ